MNRFDPLPSGVNPENLYPAYKSTRLRAPAQRPVRVSVVDPLCHGIRFDRRALKADDADLTAHGKGQPLGEKIIVSGRVLDEDSTPVRDSLIELWQANAAGRYRHPKDTHPAPLDPNFPGWGKTMTDDTGRYRFVSIKPGPYPWGNHDKAWRPAHIHFSLFGNLYAQRLVTQMYFPGDPLFAHDPIFQSVSDPDARERMVCRFSLELTEGGEALGYEFDIVLRGRNATPLASEARERP